MSTEPTFAIAYHVVCLIDLLGQKAKLAGWGELPLDAPFLPQQVEAVRETIGVLLRFRKRFETYFGQVKQCAMPARLAALPPDKQEQYWRSKKRGPSTQQFSDTFVFYAPLRTVHGDLSLIPLHRILGACCMAMLESLATRTPVRGAITIGAGTELDERTFYGPGLAQAHHLESTVAKYPRVVVATEVKRFLEQVQANEQGISLVQGSRELAIACEALLCEDTDSWSIVDFMGEGVRRLLHASQQMSRWVQMANDFVCSEDKRFGDEGNTKLQERYARLRRHIESRLPLWTAAVP